MSEISSEGDKDTIIIEIDESSPNRNKLQKPPQPARNEQAPIFETSENNTNAIKTNTAVPVEDDPEITTQPRKRDYLTSFMSLTGNTVK